jgi:hypothetical protein
MDKPKMTLKWFKQIKKIKETNKIKMWETQNTNCGNEKKGISTKTESS